MVLSYKNSLSIIDSDETVARRNGHTGVLNLKYRIGLSKCLFVRHLYKKVYYILTFQISVEL